jgi:two-component system sensor histidine kinase PilS (NtrC family)
MLIAVRVVVVTTLLLASLIIQYTVSEFLPINYLYVTAGLTYGLTLLYIAISPLIRSRDLHISIQVAGDLVIETLLVYFTGGLDSPFSFLYLVSIITASMLLYRRGGILTASGAVILYGALGDLMYYGVVRGPHLSAWFAPSPWTSSRLYLNMATNFAGFYATALLTSYLSEKLQRTFEELDVNRQSLAELRALNQNVVQSIPSGLITVAPAGTVTFINPAGCSLLRLDPHEAIGHAIADLGFFHRGDWPGVAETFSSDPVVRGETALAVAGEQRIVGYALTPLTTIEGTASGYTLIFQDLTEMKKLEAELRLKDRMAAVGELSAGIAHEIRNPLAAIAGSVQVLKKSDALSTQEQRLMSIILKESERLNKSIADFLRFVRPQEKQARTFDIAAAISETLDLLQNSPELTPEHHITRQIDPPAYQVDGDPDQIRQVFWNLARNAIQAMPNGGILTVSTYLTAGAYHILFSDSGRGMSAADQERLFQPFRTNFPSGTGLGMAISYRIVQEHGGKIEVSTKEGLGTTIAISLPANDSGRNEASKRTEVLGISAGTTRY